MEENDTEMIRATLLEALPNECRRIGPANVKDIAARRGQIRLVPLTGASRMDLGLTLTLVASAAVIVSETIAILRSLSEKWSRDRQQEISVETIVKLPKELTAKMDPKVLASLIDAVVKRSTKA